MKVRFFDYSLVPNTLVSEWRLAFEEVLSESKFVQGKQTREFEVEWASLIGSQHAVGVGNGFDGLTTALRALDLKPGDEVAVPAHTFIACWFAIQNVGGIPVGVDVDSNGLIDLDILESLKSKPKYVMPVHMHGAMVDMSRLMKWANSNGVKVIEDASQAHLASRNGKKSGTWGDVGVFSLYPTKNLGALGDAGVIVTDKEEVERKIRALTNYGSALDNKYRHIEFGANSRLDTLQAAFLLKALPNLKEWNENRNHLAMQYQTGLAGINDLVPLHHSLENQVWHHYVVKTHQRDSLRKYLLEFGVETEIHYPNTAATEYQTIFGGNQNFTVATELANSILSLPLSQWHTKEHIAHVVEGVVSFFNQPDIFANE